MNTAEMENSGDNFWGIYIFGITTIDAKTIEYHRIPINDQRFGHCWDCLFMAQHWLPASLSQFHIALEHHGFESVKYKSKWSIFHSKLFVYWKAANTGKVELTLQFRSILKLLYQLYITLLTRLIG